MFLAFCVILATLVGQGLTLPLLIRRLGVADDRADQREEALARREAAAAALARLDVLVADGLASPAEVVPLRARYVHRLEQAAAAAAGAGDPDHRIAHERLEQELLLAERSAILALRDAGEIGDAAMRRVERDLNFDTQRTTE